MKKLTKAQIEVLVAYRDGTTHNRSIAVFASLIRDGYLREDVVNGKRRMVITESGKRILDLQIEGLQV